MIEKLLCCLTTLLVTAQVTYGQTGKGSWLLGGDLSYSSYESRLSQGGMNIKSTNLSYYVQPRVGYFVYDRFAVGVDLEIGWNTSTIDNGLQKTETRANNNFVSAFARYFFYKHMFVQGSYGAGNNNADSSLPASNREFSGTKWTLGFGYAIFLRKSSALELSLSSRTSILTDKSGQLTSTVDELLVGLGLQIYLSKVHVE